MIIELIADASKKETEYICTFTKDAVAGLSDEMLKFCKCMNVEEFAALIQNGTRTDLACVDVTQPGAIGLTERFREGNRQSCIVLIANKDISPLSYMRPSISAQSLIMRPCSLADVKNTVHEAVAYTLAHYTKPDHEEVFVFKNENGLQRIPYSAIWYFESYDKKLYVVSGAKKDRFEGTLKKLEEQLAERFVRCHNSYLVNKDKVDSLQLSKNLLLLKDGSGIPVSRSYKPVIKELMHNGQL